MKSQPQLQPRLRFPHDGPDAFGPGKAELLRQIVKAKSIRGAATAMGMSYNRAWILVRTMNELFQEPLVENVRGGNTGGGASLTPCGQAVLKHYDRMEALCRKATRTEWSALTRLLRR